MTEFVGPRPKTDFYLSMMVEVIKKLGEERTV